MKDNITLGQLITGDSPPRDAIHIAIAAVEAGQTLMAGNRITIKDIDGVKTAFLAVNSGLGVVDPFLTTTVQKKQKFWMFMLPNTVNNLRHEWDHPFLAPNLPTFEKVLEGESLSNQLMDKLVQANKETALVMNELVSRIEAVPSDSDKDTEIINLKEKILNLERKLERYDEESKEYDECRGC